MVSNYKEKSMAQDSTSDPQHPEHPDQRHSTPVTKAPKKSRSKLTIGILLFLVLVGCWYGYRMINPDKAGPRINPLNLVPSSAQVIIETNHPYDTWSQISKTAIWKALEKDPDFANYGTKLQTLDNDLQSFDLALDAITNRNVYISIHDAPDDQSGLLFIVDLEGLSLIKSWLINQDNVSKRTFDQSIIYEHFDVTSKETLHFVFEDNYLSASYNHALIEASIQEKKLPEFSRSFHYLAIQKKVTRNGLVRMYVNYPTLYGNLDVIESINSSLNFSNQFPLLFSGLYFDVAEENILLHGFSNFEDSISSYLSIFHNSGTSKADIAAILPTQTSIYMSLGFDSYDEFYTSYEKNLSADPINGNDFDVYSKKTEKFFNIDLKDDFSSWIDDEIAVVQIETADQSETALIFKAHDSQAAQNGISFLSKQIKRKTPVRFKEVNYRDHTINYLAVKGLFSLMFGQLFSKYERPYYTIIDRFVIFSARPQVLRMMIDNYLDGAKLTDLESYNNFIHELGPDHSLMIYLQIPLLGQSNGGLLDLATVKELQARSASLQHFPQLAIKIKPANHLLETNVLLSVEKISKYDESIASGLMTPADINYDSLWMVDPGETQLITEIEIEDFGAKNQKENYEEGIPKYDVELKDGKKHGSYYEYHKTGELKIKGKYKNDLMEGIWKYYDTDGKLIKKEKYKKGTLI